MAYNKFDNRLSMIDHRGTTFNIIRNIPPFINYRSTFNVQRSRLKHKKHNKPRKQSQPLKTILFLWNEKYK